MNIFSQIFKFWDAFNGKYRKNPIPQNLTPEQFAAINIGAINAEQTMYFCDSLPTGSDADEIRDNLSNYYDISDRDSALETLEWFYSSGHRVYFDIIKDFISGRVSQIDPANLDLDDDEAESRIQEYCSNLQESLDELIQENFLKQQEDLAQCSILAWDMGRMVLVTRCCFDSGYISYEEAWRYIFNARQASKKQYTSWSEFASGYVIGRAMWSGSNMSLTGIISVTQGLLQDDESPWKQTAF